MDAMRFPDVATLSSQQKAHLLEHDCVWAMGIGVLWNPTDGALRSNNAAPRLDGYLGRSACTERKGYLSRPRQAEATEGESSHEGETVARPTPRQTH